MSEALRKDFHTKAGEKMVCLLFSPLEAHLANTIKTPDSSKSTLDKTKESLTGTGDKIARESQPGTFLSFPLDA
jgi:hypothetical protein